MGQLVKGEERAVSEIKGKEWSVSKGRDRKLVNYSKPVKERSVIVLVKDRGVEGWEGRGKGSE